LLSLSLAQFVFLGHFFISGVYILAKFNPKNRKNSRIYTGETKKYPFSLKKNGEIPPGKKKENCYSRPYLLGFLLAGRKQKLFKKIADREQIIKFARLLIIPPQIDAIKTAAASRSASFAGTVGTRGSH
jgi:hypothetical protein